MTTDPRDGFTPGPWSVEFNTYRENNGSLTVTDSYINSPDGLRMFLDCDPEQASRIVDGMNERNALLADNERQAKVIEEVVAVLSSLEWIPAERTDCNVFYRCPCCGVRKDVEGHAYGCPLHSALALVGGGE